MARSRVNDATYLEDRVVELIERLPKDGSTVDLQEYFQRLTFDSAIDYLCGERLDSDQEAEAKTTIRSHFHTAMIEIGRRSKLGAICQLDMFTRPMGFYRYIRSALAMNHYFEKLVMDRSTRLAVMRERNGKESVRLREEFQPEPFVFLDHLAEATTDHGQIKWELATAVAAARDTTASLMAHVFWELSRRDAIWAALQHEVQMLNGSAPTFADLDRMLYLKAVIKEGVYWQWSDDDYVTENASTTHVFEHSQLKPMGNARHGPSQGRRSRRPVTVLRPSRPANLDRIPRHSFRP